MKKIYPLIALFVLFTFSSRAQLFQLLTSDITTIANTGPATVLKTNGTVKISEIGCQGTANTYIELNNSNATPVLNSTSNDAITIESTADITSLVLKYSANGAGNTTNPYVGYSPTITAMGSATVAISSCEMNASGVTGITQTSITYTVPAGTRFIILVRNKACSPVSANSNTSRISQIDVGYVAAPVVPTVTTATATPLTSSTASGGGNVTSDGGQSVDERGVCWSTSLNPTVADPRTMDGTGTGAFTSSLTGLSANTLYHVRAYAHNSIGYAYGSDQTFTTPIATVNYYNLPSSDITVTTNWGTNTNGTGTNPTDFSTAGQVFNLTNTGATMSTGWTVSGASSKLVIGDGVASASLTIPASAAYTGTVDVKANGTLVLQNTTMPTFGALDVASTINFDAINTPNGITFGNLGLLNGANFGAGTVSGVRGTFSPNGNGPATATSTIIFNGTSAQLVPGFVYDSLVINNAAGSASAGSNATIKVNRGLKVSQNFTIAAGDTLKLAGANGASMVIDASKQLTANGNVILQTPVAPTVTGTLAVNSGGKYVVDVNVGNNTGFIPTATYNAGSEILVLQGSPRIPATIGGDVTWSSVGTGSYLNSTSNTIGGNLTINAGQINHGSGGTSRSLTVSGNLNINGGRYDVLGAPGSGSTGQSLTVNGNVNISGGALYATAGTSGSGVGSVTIKGNLNHTAGAVGNANITLTDGNFIFNGAAAQTISTVGFSDTVGIAINNAGNVTLSSGNIDLKAGVLTFSNGKLIVGNNNIAVGSISGATSSRYVVTDGTGSLTINNIAASTSATFPVGASTTAYNPVILATNAGHTTDNFSVRVSPDALTGGTAGSPFTADWVGRGWNITEGTPGGSDVNLTLQWSASQELSGFDRTNCTISHWDGVAWDDLSGANASGSDPYTISRNNVTTFSPFGVQKHQTPTPLSLLAFNATMNNGLAKLFWTTTNEINVQGFAIERGGDGRNFSPVGNVVAFNSSGTHAYQFNDPATVNGIAYYRLKMIDKDGKFKYSTVIAVSNSKEGNLGIFPNPVSDQLFAVHPKAKAGATIEMYSLDGRKMGQGAVTKDAVQSTLDTKALPKGVYQLVYINEGKVLFTRFVKQ